MPTPAEVRRLIGDLSDVGKLVHLAWRMDSVDEQEISGTIFKAMRRSYERKMTEMARRAGCGQRRGLLDEGQTLSNLRQTANDHAASIVRTYNAALARQIQAIRDEVPTANRNLYSARLRRWDNARAGWKESQIALMSYQEGTDLATREFIQFNPQVEQEFRAQPRTAAEPECQALVDAGTVDAEFVQANGFPLHVNCVHEWELQPTEADDCNELFLGQPIAPQPFGTFAKQLEGAS